MAGVSHDDVSSGLTRGSAHETALPHRVDLCSRDAQAEVLHDFLDSIRCRTLYLVGDIIDIWAFQRKAYWPKQYNEVLHKLLKFSRKGTRVVFIPGNHDEFFREFVGYHMGDVEVTAEAVHETADGRRLWVVHGDQFDAAVVLHPSIARIGDWAYTQLIYLNRMVNRVRTWMGKPYWSLSGAIKRKVKHAVKFMNGFESIVIEETRRRDVDGIICGHIHQPAVRRLGGMLYYNTGDWIENCTALVESDEARLVAHGNDRTRPTRRGETPQKARTQADVRFDRRRHRTGSGIRRSPGVVT